MVSTGPNYPSAAVEDTTVGDGDAFWTNLSNLYSDGVDATLQNDHTDAISYYIKATDYGFAIPAGATIDGIEVQIYQLYNTDGSHIDSYVYSIKLVKRGRDFRR